MKTLETKRMLMRPFGNDDLADLYEYASSPLVGPAAGWEPHANLEVSQNILEQFIRDDEVWALELKSNGRVVGSLGLHTDALRLGKQLRAKMLGYVLAEDYWGQGLMAEAVKQAIRYAFEELELDILSCMHYPDNKRSQRVIEKSGFVYEGKLRRSNVRYDGRIMDQMCYSLLRPEYEALNYN